MRSLCLWLVLGCSSTGLPTTGGTSGGPQPNACGGKQGSTCAMNEFCAYPANSPCGNLDVPGVCKPRPSACDTTYAPACGCDGAFYNNICYANAAGIDTRPGGPCESAPKFCGGEANTPCAADEYCDYPPGQMCNWADGGGECKKRPQVCPELYMPVCGCDNMTYGNDCRAAVAGQGTAYQGECAKPTSDCLTTGCPTGETCTLCWASYQCLPPNVVC
jgi:hypothetical protein